MARYEFPFLNMTPKYKKRRRGGR